MFGSMLSSCLDGVAAMGLEIRLIWLSVVMKRVRCTLPVYKNLHPSEARVLALVLRHAMDSLASCAGVLILLPPK